jgi:hypothetical protein
MPAAALRSCPHRSSPPSFWENAAIIISSWMSAAAMAATHFFSDPTAIEPCRTAAAAAGIENVDFDTADVSSRDLEIKSAHHLKNNGAPLIYARFFIHAITEQEERKFLLFARSHLGQGTLAVEFRTMRDEALHKVTEGHYRRFVDPVAFAGRARDVGLDVVYLVEGFWMAKYKKDDAFVARVLLRRNAA